MGTSPLPPSLVSAQNTHKTLNSRQPSPYKQGLIPYQHCVSTHANLFSLSSFTIMLIITARVKPQKMENQTTLYLQFVYSKNSSNTAFTTKSTVYTGFLNVSTSAKNCPLTPFSLPQDKAGCSNIRSNNFWKVQKGHHRMMMTRHHFALRNLAWPRVTFGSKLSRDDTNLCLLQSQLTLV